MRYMLVERMYEGPQSVLKLVMDNSQILMINQDGFNATGVVAGFTRDV